MSEFNDGVWWSIETIFSQDDMMSIELIKTSKISRDEAITLAKKSDVFYPKIIDFFDEFKVWKV